MKLVVTCQTDAWELNHLWRDISSSEIFSLEPPASGQRRRYSFVLDNFSPDEQAEARARPAVSSRKGEQASPPGMRAPGLATWPNPYCSSA